MRKSIAFIYLPHPWLKRPEAQLPLGILYLAAITQYDYMTNVYNYSGWAFDSALDDIEEHDFFAITATSLEIPMANDFGTALKHLYPNSKLLIGGPGTVTPDYIARCFDLIFIGEAESELLGFLDKLQTSDIKYLHSNRTGIKNLDILPFPARGLISGKLGSEIFAHGKHYTGEESTTIISSRGCPYRCAFCAAPNVKVRFREPQFVVEEMEMLFDRRGISEFRFSDDSFTMDPSRVIELCKLLTKTFAKNTISWRVSCRVKPMHREVIRSMVEAGCKEFSVGIESFDQDVLDRLTKGVTVEENIHALKIINDVGGNARILFMIRTPGQTMQTVDKNIEVLSKVPYELIACTSFAPLPGSTIWEEPESFGIRILSRNLEDYNFYFYSSEGRQNLPYLFEYLTEDTDMITADSERFRSYLESTGRLNRG